MQEKIKFVFFGSSEFSVYVLDELKSTGFLPSLIVTNPDAPKGRGLVLAPTPVKLWAEKNGIEVYQPSVLDSSSSSKLSALSSKLFIVASYGFIIPKNIIDIPKFGVLNVHPSLLPKWRGPSPIQSQILADKPDEVGVSIMLLDEKMDHGPIFSQRKVTIGNWPPRADVLEKILAKEGAQMLAEIIPNWVNGKLTPVPQKHNEATICKKISKEDGLLDLTGDSRKNFLKFQAYFGWPGVYFFASHKSEKIRVAIKDAQFENNKFEILRVLPEGKKEMDYESFLRGLK